MRSQQQGAVVGAVFLLALGCFSGVLAVMNFLRAEELERRLAYLQQQAEKIGEERDAQRQLAEGLKTRLGLKGEDPVELFVAMEAAARARGVDRTYPQKLDAMIADADLKAAELRKLRNDLATAKSDLAAANATRQAALAQLESKLKEREQEALAATGASAELAAKLQAEIDRLRSGEVRLKDRLRELERQQEVALGDLNKKLADLRAELKAYRQQGQPGESAAPVAAQAAGTVVAYDPSTKLVTLNWGKEAGARPGVTLRLHRPDSVGKPAAEVATVEVVQATARSSKARVLTNDLLVPILAGDLAFNPLIGGGKGEAVGLVGKLDYDDDGQDDSAALARMVEAQGGAVALRVDLQGKSRGRLTPKLKYLVVDEPARPPAGADPRRDYYELVNRLRQEANQMGVTVLSSRKLIQELGLKPDRGAVPREP